MKSLSQYRQQNPIATRLMGMILLISSLFAVVAILLQLYFGFQSDIQQLEKRLDQVRISALPSISNSLWSFDEEQLNIQINSLLQVEDVVQVTLVWNDWKNQEQAMIASSLGNQPSLTEIGDTDQHTFTKEYPLSYVGPKGNDDQALGRLIITASLNSAYNNLWARAQLIGGLQFIYAIILSIVIFLMIRVLLTRHIASIASYTRNLNLEKLTTPLRLERKKKDYSDADELDNVVGAINQMRSSLMEDVTRRRAVEQAFITEKEEKLESRRLKAAADEANSAKSQFLATMSHEIRTPMNGVIGMVELLRDTPLNENQTHYLDVIHRSGETLLAIINDILDYSKIEAGKMELEKAPFNLEELIEDCVQLFSATSNKRRIELVGSVAPNAPTFLYGDPTRLRQILINLLGNAFKFTKKGCVTIKVELESPPEDNSPMLRFSVIDTGIGISKSVQDRLFSSFSQADNSTTRKYGGTGLGLAICKSLAELMGGRIGLESVEGQGSNFWFTAKLSLNHSAIDSAPSPIDANLNDKSILIVEDNPSLSEVLAHHCSNWGMDVYLATTYQQCLDKLQTRRGNQLPDFDFISLDYFLDEADGMTLANTICGLYPDLGSKRFLLTGSDSEFDPQLLEDNGVLITIRKPVSPKALQRELASLSGSHLQKGPHNKSQEPTETDLSHLRILVAEDNTINRMVIDGLLNKLNITPILTENGRQACDQIINNNHFDLVLMDCEMPEMDGFEATETIRQYEKDNSRNRVPIIALTAHAMEEHRQAVMDSGMDQFLCKPITLQQLREAIETSISEPAATVQI